jgi:probable DNA metabolism protein
MITIEYDGSFEGFLSAVFDIYDYKFTGPFFFAVTGKVQPTLNERHHLVYTNVGKAERVHKGLLNHISPVAAKQLYKTYLSETKNVENILFSYIQYAFRNKESIEYDYGNPAVLEVIQTARKVDRERHRMTAFVRFQQAKDGLFLAIVAPDFNVLPLIIRHFKDRYADQRWLIYDKQRNYGIYYNLETVEFIQLDSEANNHAEKVELHENEGLYQVLWQQYFKSVNIQSRKNLLLHIRHMPKRYWRYLVEKQ